MDFSTITEKLNGGSYGTVQEFEHDISLVYNNAMQFNDSDTIYYKQARAIKELANKLFRALKADPQNFETECSMINVRPSRRIKAISGSLDSNSGNNTNGRKYERGSHNLELQPRWTYSSHTSSLNGNEPVVTQVYNSTKNLEPVKEKRIGYSESLLRFVKNLGPTAQMVAKRMLGRGMAESSNYHLQVSNNQNSAVVSAGMELSSGLLQRFSGKKEDIQNGILNRRKVLSVDKIDIYDVLRGGIAQTSSTMKTLGEIHKTRGQASNNQFTAAEFARKGITVAPSLKVDGNSTGCINHSGKQLDIHSGTSLGNGFNEHVSVTGDVEVDLPAEQETNSSPNKFNFVKLMLGAINYSPEQTTEVVSSGSEMQELLPTSYSCLSSSLLWPLQSVPGGLTRSQDIDFMHGVDLHNLDGVQQNQAMEGQEGTCFGGNIEQGIQVLNWLKSKVDNGSSSTQAIGSIQGLDSHYLGVCQAQATADEAGLSHGGNVLHGGEVSNWFKLPGSRVDELGPSHGNTVNGGEVSNWFKLTGSGVDELGPSHGNTVNGGKVSNWFKLTGLGVDELGPSHGNTVNGGQLPNWFKLTGSGVDELGPSHGNTVNGGQVPNWFKPTELGPEPIPDDWLQKQCGSLAEVELFCQAESSQQQGADMTPYDGKPMKTSNMCDIGKCGTPGAEQFTVGGPGAITHS
ncbi:uncharacterized protein LOC123228209 isoform X2 [Mangifera indica]|nr:uncharacterized protein LOC123228209 isoform X2 [Mangifera indica]